MDRSIISGLIAILLIAKPALAEDLSPKHAAQTFAYDLIALSGFILKHHVNPPAGQQIMLKAARALYLASNQDPPRDLALRCSTAQTPDQFATILVDACGKNFETDQAAQRTICAKVAEALTQDIEGGVTLLTPKASAAQQQLSENRYVGVGIAAGQNDDRAFFIRAVMPGGPMDRAGVPAETQIISIDGWKTRGESLVDAVERLRGPNGSRVELVIRRPGSDRDEPLSLDRGVVPRKSLQTEVRELSDRRIAVLKLEEITASIPHEVRAFVQQQRELDGVLLDLRGASGQAHFGVLLADLFVDGGDLGYLSTEGKKSRLQAEPGDLFNDLPMAVIADPSTTGSAAWLATSLHERKRVVSYGQNSDRRNLDFASFELPSKSLVATFATSVLTAPSSVDGLIVTNQVTKIPDAAEVERAIAVTNSKDPSAAALNNLVRVGGQFLGRESSSRRNPEDTALQYLQSIPKSVIHPKKS